MKFQPFSNLFLSLSPGNHRMLFLCWNAWTRHRLAGAMERTERMRIAINDSDAKCIFAESRTEEVRYKH